MKLQQPPLDTAIVYRKKESFNHAQEIIKPFGVLEQVLDWCKENTRGEWRWQLVEMSSDIKPGRYIFFFDDDLDCFAFVLKWVGYEG